MPMPMPMMDEDHEGFMDRCMGDDMMNKDYPDDKQRKAVCEQQWDDSEEEDSKRSVHTGNAPVPAGVEGRGVSPFEFDQLEVRTSEGESGQKLIRGHGAVYNKLS